MSGTLAYAQRLDAAQQAEAEHRTELFANQNAVKNRLSGIVKEVTGWSIIDDWANTTIERSMSGEMVDLDELDRKITEWQQAQQAPPEGGA